MASQQANKGSFWRNAKDVFIRTRRHPPSSWGGNRFISDMNPTVRFPFVPEVRKISPSGLVKRNCHVLLKDVIGKAFLILA